MILSSNIFTIENSWSVFFTSRFRNLESKFYLILKFYDKNHLTNNEKFPLNQLILFS